MKSPIVHFSIVLAFCAALFTASCSSEDFISEPDGRQDGSVISTARITTDDFVDEAQPAMRTTINNNGTFLWARGDQVGVWPTLEEGEEPTASQVLFTIDQGAGTNSATFTGSGWGLLHNRTYYAYYPYRAAAMSNTVTNTYQNNLIQMFNNMTFHLGVNDFMYSSVTTPEEGNTANFQFHHMGSLMRIVINLPSSASSIMFKSVSVSAKGGKEVFPIEVTYNPSVAEPVETVVSATSTQHLSLGLNGNGFKPSSNSITAWFLVGATDLSGTTFNVVISKATSVYSGTFQGALQQAGHARSYTVTAAEGEPDEAYVDMGTGVLWAKANLGATAPEHFGDYYAWGETTPHYSALSINETQSTPKVSSVTWKSGYTGGYAWSNYFDTSDGGKTFKTYNKSKMTLSLTDDAAHVALGDKWRMPTTEEVISLYEGCTLKATTVNGVKGVQFTSKKTGNSIFIPGNGYFSGTTYTCSSNGFRMWSSTNSSTTLGYGWHCTYSNPTNEFQQYARDRLRGCGIRPVYDPGM